MSDYTTWGGNDRVEIRKQVIGGALLLLSSAVLVGCGLENRTAKAATVPTTKSGQHWSRFDRKLAATQHTAQKNRPALLASLKGLKPFYSGTGAAYLTPLPTKLKDEAQRVNTVLRGTIVQTDFATFDHTAHTVYTLFVTAVYQGDSALRGQEISVLTAGGKIKNADLYAQHQQKSLIPPDQKLTAAELQENTLVRTDGFDPAAPGDEIVATLTKVHSNALNRAVYLTISPEWLFYRTAGTQNFVMHAQPTAAELTAGQHGTVVTPDMDSVKGRIVADVQEMVATGRIPE